MPKASGLIELRNGRSNDRPSLSQQFQNQRNRHSCTTRKMAVSKSFGSRPKLSGTSKSTLISMRAVSPSAYHRSAAGEARCGTTLTNCMYIQITSVNNCWRENAKLFGRVHTRRIAYRRKGRGCNSHRSARKWERELISAPWRPRCRFGG